MGMCSVCNNRAYVRCCYDKTPMCNYCHAVYHQIIMRDQRFLGPIIPLVPECSRYRQRKNNNNKFIEVKRKNRVPN